MPTRKPRRKRHNATKRARQFFGNVRIWTWEADRSNTDQQFATVQARTARGWETLTGRVAQAVTEYPNNWIICVRALCRAGGETWVEDETRIIRDVALSDFSGLYMDLRREVLAAQRIDQVIDVGWIAGTFTKEARDHELVMHGLGTVTESRQAVWRRVNSELMESTDDR